MSRAGGGAATIAPPPHRDLRWSPLRFPTIETVAQEIYDGMYQLRKPDVLALSVSACDAAAQLPQLLRAAAMLPALHASSLAARSAAAPEPKGAAGRAGGSRGAAGAAKEALRPPPKPAVCYVEVSAARCAPDLTPVCLPAYSAQEDDGPPLGDIPLRLRPRLRAGEEASARSHMLPADFLMLAINPRAADHVGVIFPGDAQQPQPLLYAALCAVLSQVPLVMLIPELVQRPDGTVHLSVIASWGNMPRAQHREQPLVEPGFPGPGDLYPGDGAAAGALPPGADSGREDPAREG
eukprot:TRINITY_DN3665_c0_g2_i1.p1 TRINITY_DN3665_c0_g2~~TRINITY_DN3665_c0_g2_i1.p1  ORF type:complete len:325 (+),score=79.59 TRINITY_DN3665_c0_g2_i1:94-975(+)